MSSPSQDEIVAQYIVESSTGAASLTATLVAYHYALTTNLFQIALLDDAHKEQIRDAARTNMLTLRNRLDGLSGTVRLAMGAPDI